VASLAHFFCIELSFSQPAPCIKPSFLINQAPAVGCERRTARECAPRHMHAGVSSHTVVAGFDCGPGQQRDRRAAQQPV
jgi:hypothetical protein